MTKTELVDAVANCANVTKVEARRCIDCYHSAITGELSAGNKVALANFGTFAVTVRGARAGRNPQTGEVIHIRASKNVRFKPSKNLRERIE